MASVRRRTWEPPADLARRVVPIHRLGARVWYRVHAAGESAVAFRLADHHRFSHPQCPHAVLYLGADPSTCLWERFGDALFGGAHTLSYRFLAGFVLSRFEVPTLAVCDLTSTRVRNALAVDRATLMHPDLEVTQAWGLALQNHPAGFAGLRYTSRFLDRPCLALFAARTGGAMPRSVTEGGVLDLPATTEWIERQRVRLV